MRFIDIGALAFRGVLRGGVKAALCVLAFCVGICSTCTVITLGGTASTAVSGEIDRIGVGGMAFYTSDKEYSVNEAELSAVSVIDGVSAAMPLSLQLCGIWLKGQGSQAMLCGVGSGLRDVFNISLLHGRLPSVSDELTGANVIVIDDALALGSYRRENVVGKKVTVTLGGKSGQFEIIGVIRSQKQGVEGLLGGNIPSFVYAPHTAVDSLAGTTSSDKIAVACAAGYSESDIANEIIRRLERATGYGFRHENLNQYAGSLKSIMDTVSLFAAGVAGISIIVGGMGVMNSMISSVDSRTRDIGVYLAMGARRRDILACFLLEAQLLCVLGAVFGVALSVGLFKAISMALGLDQRVDWTYMSLILLGATVCGTVFGILPALRAARMNPIEAMKEI